MYVGNGRPEKKIFVNGKNVHRRSLYSKYGTSSTPAIKKIVGEENVTESEREEKYKYIYVIKHDKRQYKEVMKKLKVKSLPYPKGELSFYSEGGGNRFDQIGDEKVVNPKDKVKDLFE